MSVERYFVILHLAMSKRPNRRCAMKTTFPFIPKGSTWRNVEGANSLLWMNVVVVAATV
jgi:hypothetical protein